MELKVKMLWLFTEDILGDAAYSTLSRKLLTEDFLDVPSQQTNPRAQTILGASRELARVL